MNKIKITIKILLIYVFICWLTSEVYVEVDKKEFIKSFKLASKSKHCCSYYKKDGEYLYLKTKKHLNIFHFNKKLKVNNNYKIYLKHNILNNFAENEINMEIENLLKNGEFDEK